MKVASTVLLALGIVIGSISVVQADSAAEMLEKGIYNEDTIGNLDEAIKIYRKVVTTAGETQVLGAQAQYRLGQCLLKQGKKEDATLAFQELVEKYPKQKKYVKLARKHISEDPVFGAAPWKDGERLTMRMKLAGGQDIGMVGVGVNSAKLKGKDVWEMTIRRYVDGGNNEGVSKVWVNKQSFRPRRTIFDHTVLGVADAVWTDEEIKITQLNPGKDKKESTVELESVAYSNDQVFYGFRQLPVKIGYEATLPLRVAFTGGNAIGLEVSVEKKEKVETPAGTFDCFRLDTNIQQTFWVADVPERYMVQFEAGGVTAKLESISYATQEETFVHEDMDFACTVPQGWFHLSRGSDNNLSGGVLLVAPEMASATLYVKDKSELKEKERNSVEAWMDSKIARSKRAFKRFEVGPKGIEKTNIGDLPALAIQSTPEISKREVAIGLTLGIGKEKTAQFATNAGKAQSEAAQKQFDTIRKSFTLR